MHHEDDPPRDGMRDELEVRTREEPDEEVLTRSGLAGSRRVADGDGFGTATAAFVLVKVDVVDHDCCW